jgi:hypothetical protein
MSAKRVPPAIRKGTVAVSATIAVFTSPYTNARTRRTPTKPPIADLPDDEGVVEELECFLPAFFRHALHILDPLKVQSRKFFLQ